MLTVKTVLGIIVGAGLLFLAWKFMRWIIVVVVILGLLIVGYYVKTHHWPTQLIGGLLHH